MPNGLVRQHCPESAPTGIEDTLCHVGFCQRRATNVADDYETVLLGNASRKFVVKVPTTIRHLGGKTTYLPTFLRPLGDRQLHFVPSIDSRGCHLLPGTQRREVFQSQVDSDFGADVPPWGLGDFDTNVEVPVTSRVFRKAAAVSNLRTFRKRPTVKDAEEVAVELEGVAFGAQVAPLEGHPTKVLSSSIPQVRPTVLGTTCRVPLARGVDGSRMQLQLLRGTRSELVQVEARGPTSAPAKSVLLSVVAVVPNEIDRSGLGIEKPRKRLDPIAVNSNNHSPNVVGEWGQVKWSLELGSTSSSACMRISCSYRSTGSGYSMLTPSCGYEAFSESSALTLKRTSSNSTVRRTISISSSIIRRSSHSPQWSTRSREYRAGESDRNVPTSLRGIGRAAFGRAVTSSARLVERRFPYSRSTSNLNEPLQLERGSFPPRPEVRGLQESAR
jgi:hypothetical protein